MPDQMEAKAHTAQTLAGNPPPRQAVVGGGSVAPKEQKILDCHVNNLGRLIDKCHININSIGHAIDRIGIVSVEGSDLKQPTDAVANPQPSHTDKLIGLEEELTRLLHKLETASAALEKHI